MAYAKAKLKSNGDEASPCFKPSLRGNMSVIPEGTTEVAQPV